MVALVGRAFNERHAWDPPASQLSGGVPSLGAGARPPDSNRAALVARPPPRPRPLPRLRLRPRRPPRARGVSGVWGYAGGLRDARRRTLRAWCRWGGPVLCAAILTLWTVSRWRLIWVSKLGPFSIGF